VKPLHQGKAWLRGVPLRVKLVTSVLALVAAALLVISSLTTVFLHGYLIDQVDGELRRTTSSVDTVLNLYKEGRAGGTTLPSDFMVSLAEPGGVMSPVYDNRNFRPEQLPQIPSTIEGFAALTGEPFTVNAQDRRSRWRMLYTPLRDGEILVVGQHLTDVDLAVKRLVWIDLLVGGAVLILLASVGAAIVRTSLKPLVEIERTAAAIAGGDLTRRVPDPEEGQECPTSELGRLSRALNAMLTQIEAAFTARAASETAARSAEAAARDAAGAPRSGCGSSSRTPHTSCGPR
jgi:two-component system OmpR family sensor kinase